MNELRQNLRGPAKAGTPNTELMQSQIANRKSHIPRIGVTEREVARIFGLGLRRMRKISRESGVQPWLIGGETLFGVEHVLALNQRKDDAALKRALGEYFLRESLTAAQFKLLVDQSNGMAAAVNVCYEMVRSLEERMLALEKKRGPKLEIHKEAA